MSVQYTGRCAVHREVCSTPGGYHWVHQGDMIEYTGDVQYTGGISWEHWGVFSTVGGYHEYTGGYHDECGGISWVHQGMFSTVGFPYKFNCICNDLTPHLSWYPPVYWTPPVYSWYPPLYSWYPLGVLNIPQCTAHPLVYCTDIIQGAISILRTVLYGEVIWGVDNVYYKTVLDFVHT